MLFLTFLDVRAAPLDHNRPEEVVTPKDLLSLGLIGLDARGVLSALFGLNNRFERLLQFAEVASQGVDSQRSGLEVVGPAPGE